MSEYENLIARLRAPLWLHSDAGGTFKSPQLSKDETISDLTAAADEIDLLTSKLERVIKVIDDKIEQYKEIETNRGGLTELGRHAQMSVVLLRKDIEYEISAAHK